MKRIVIWSAVDAPGLEHLSLIENDSQVRADGLVFDYPGLFNGFGRAERALVKKERKRIIQQSSGGAKLRFTMKMRLADARRGVLPGKRLKEGYAGPAEAGPVRREP